LLHTVLDLVYKTKNDTAALAHGGKETKYNWILTTNKHSLPESSQIEEYITLTT